MLYLLIVKFATCIKSEQKVALGPSGDLHALIQQKHGCSATLSYAAFKEFIRRIDVICVHIRGWRSVL